VIIPLALGCVLVAAFVLRGLRIAHPLLDLRLYAIRAFSSATAVMFCLGAAQFATMILLPLYFQNARGADPIETGLLLIPQGLGGAAGMYSSASVTSRFGAGLASMYGTGILLAATVPFLFIGATTPYSILIAFMVVRGFGSALATMPAFTAAFTAVDHDQVDDASPQLNVIQRVGGSLGTAIIAVVLQTKLNEANAASGGQASLGAIATAFNQTYAWVIAMIVVALVPCVVLWRVERRLGRTGARPLSAEESFIEVPV
jgi:predicted MFS family arabinose efflux permease